MRHRLFLLLTMACGALPGQGVSLGWGRLHEVGVQDYTYTWQMQYFQPFGEKWGATLGWLNEGHIPDHHRDGAEIQVWRTHRIPTNDLQLGVGLGAYYYFDTTKGRGEDPSVYQNRHGLKPLLSLRAQYPISIEGWALFLQVNRTLDSNGPQTQAMLVGASFLFGPAVPEKRREPVAQAKNGEEAQNELAMMFGRTILNSFESESTSLFDAYSVEYCRHISHHLEVSLTYSDEGSIDSVKRDGIAFEGWLSAHSSQQDWDIAFGLGPYFNRTFPSGEGSNRRRCVTVRTSLRYSMRVSRRLWNHWSARLQWDRTATSHHSDTDVLLAGLVYRW